jgi:hypothetical protein
MNYLNISTQMMGESESAGAEPLEIGIWIRLTLYSIDQENGGIIANSREWNDRKWRNICRISAEEANVVSELFWFVGDDLHLWNYPMESEEKVASKREAGKRGGKARSEAKINAAKANGLKSLDSCLGGGPSTIEKCLGGGQAETEVASGTPKHKDNGNGNGKGKGNGKRNGNEKDNGEGEAQSEVEAEPEAPIPSDATAEPTDAHTALRAVADLGVEYFLDLKANPAYKAIDLQLEAGKANAWAQANRRKFTKRFFVNWLNRGLDRAAATSADASLHSAKHPKYGW